MFPLFSFYPVKVQLTPITSTWPAHHAVLVLSLNSHTAAACTTPSALKLLDILLTIYLTHSTNIYWVQIYWAPGIVVSMRDRPWKPQNKTKQTKPIVALCLGNHFPNQNENSFGARTHSFHFPQFSQYFVYSKRTINNKSQIWIISHLNVSLIHRSLSTRPSFTTRDLGRWNDAFPLFLISHLQCLRPEAEAVKSPTQYKDQPERQHSLSFNHSSQLKRLLPAKMILSPYTADCRPEPC